jgi:hypothetical protein
MTDYISQASRAVQAVRIESHSTYYWFGKRYRIGQNDQSLDLSAARNLLVTALQLRLYASFYCQGIPTATLTPLDSIPQFPVAVRAIPFVNQLSLANTGTGQEEFGWTVRDIQARSVRVARDGLELCVDVDDCISVASSQVREGAVVALPLPKESWVYSPGFYLARSDVPFPGPGLGKITRVYWNVTSAGAIRLMRMMTHSLNRAHVPFSLKVWIHQLQFPRCDSAVLYSRAVDYPAVSAAMSSLYPNLVGQLYPRTPALTKRLAMGLGFAEDPAISRVSDSTDAASWPRRWFELTSRASLT